MDTRKRSEDTDPLAEPMRREALRLRPEFSAALDVRLRAALHTLTTARPQSRVASWRKFRGHLLSWAVAASASVVVLVASALVCHTVVEGPGAAIVQATPLEPAKPPADDIDSTAAVVENTANDLGQWVATTVDDNQWAGLDRDAQTAVATVAGSLPFDLSAALAVSDRPD